MWYSARDSRTSARNIVKLSTCHSVACCRIAITATQSGDKRRLLQKCRLWKLGKAPTNSLILIVQKLTLPLQERQKADLWREHGSTEAQPFSPARLALMLGMRKNRQP
eukprot:3658126-Rhodomonas_salina.1